ncbi:glycosyltransferase family 9 protein [Paraburkholderia sp. RL17-337-BIB-A]|uniref:glycosyltransferase family 9 protein n=1 Tax=Paraburkholderia sp. RL17-337-BIB-A TaxID=3031636 RepID=UPI0038B747B1
MNAMLQRANSIAVVMSPAIGDTLLAMVLVNNLVRNGFRPMVVGWVMEDLAQWFPGIDVRPASEMPPRVDLVIQLYATAAGRALSADGELCEISRLDAFNKAGHMIERFVAVARDTFGLANVTRDTGIVAPCGIRPRTHAARVALHPTGSHDRKIWPRAKFAALAGKLIRRGFEPTFLVAPDEKPAWLMDEDIAPYLHSFVKFVDVAAWIAESGFFIGNDSGLGHLASALGVPTPSLFMRRGLALTWRPNWGRGAIVLPHNLFVGGALKERFWKQALRASRVMHSFERLKVELELR